MASLGGGGRKENILMRAVKNPHLVKKVIDRAANHGIRETIDLVRSRISDELAIGYSCSGTVIEIGPGVNDLRPGDRVACAGAGFANHAQYNFVPRNLIARLPDNVSHEEGAFATLGAIALQGVRRCDPKLGDRVVVLGLGLLGQLTAQLLRLSGAIVIGVDVRADRVEKARHIGMNLGFTVGERDFVKEGQERIRALEVRDVLAYRLLRGMISLTRRYPATVVNEACAKALSHDAFRYRTLVALCKRLDVPQRSLFTSDHE